MNAVATLRSDTEGFVEDGFSVLKPICSIPTDSTELFQSLAWNGDGTLLAIHEADRRIKLLPWTENSIPARRENGVFADGGSLQLPTSIRSYEWHPTRLSLLALAARDEPIALMDTGSGTRTASFYLQDHNEQFIAPHSIQITIDGRHLVAATKHQVVTFSLEQGGIRTPIEVLATCGRDIPLWEPQMKGILSCAQLQPMSMTSGGATGVIAIGSFDNSLGIYDHYTSRPCQLKISLEHGTGVSCLRWSPDGLQLFAASRQSDVIECWDVRACRSLYTIQRPGRTNQRLVFDVLDNGMLVSGATDGTIRLWRGEELIKSWDGSAGTGIAVNCVHQRPSDANKPTVLASTYGDRAAAAAALLQPSSDSPLGPLSEAYIAKAAAPISAAAVWDVDCLRL
ncbi:heterotrimeric G protein beta subunit Gnr1 [Schizosaccharomyces japonicus yFS275]|uniref:Heterotrimeric G protein beta subunit Gnr1 n=1 Tax=Schizosaccharomyces japonicus (strain yFS275 / FY16936) TaxID=402676 RepID=B6K6D7_SCHJY|nr:heterotrimeric G protein beta subunit Gnr1 [Schizosaccharomyces japonicus yFS275]EEB09091.1 heterotrimeric G protein beta subunit Gnr1 [Schizosaccharomyces japonicus yFS275]